MWQVYSGIILVMLIAGCTAGVGSSVSTATPQASTPSVQVFNITAMERHPLETITFRVGDAYTCAIGDVMDGLNSGTEAYIERMHIAFKGDPFPPVGETVYPCPGCWMTTEAVIPSNLPGYDGIQIRVDGFEPGTRTGRALMTSNYWCQIIQGEMTWFREMAVDRTNCAARDTSIAPFDPNVVVPGDCSCEGSGCE